MKEKKVYVIQEIAGSADGRPKINIMGASSYSTTNDFIFLLPELSQIIFSPGPLIFKLRKGLKINGPGEKIICDNSGNKKIKSLDVE